MYIICAASSTGWLTAAIVVVIVVISVLYNKYKNERKKRREAEDRENRRKLYDFAESFKKEKANAGKYGHFLAICYYDLGVKYMFFVDEERKVKQVLEEHGILAEMNAVDWYASRNYGYYTDFHLLNEGFDWYIDQDECYYATPCKPKKRRR